MGPGIVFTDVVAHGQVVHSGGIGVLGKQIAGAVVVV